MFSVFQEIEQDLVRFGGQLLTSMPARCTASVLCMTDGAARVIELMWN